MKTEIIVVLDRSASMSSIRPEMVQGLKRFVEEQAKLGDGGFTLARFDDQYEMVMEGVPLSSVKLEDDVLIPRGNTALLDAVGKTVVSQGERFSKMDADNKPERVALLIVTDGEENSSTEWDGAKVSALLKRQQDEWKWAVTLLGCDIDALAAGKSMGIAAGQSLSVGRHSKAVGASFAVASASVGAYRDSGHVRSYTDDERQSTK